MKIIEKNEIPQAIAVLLSLTVIIAAFIYFHVWALIGYVSVGVIVTLIYRNKTGKIKFMFENEPEKLSIIRGITFWPFAPVIYRELKRKKSKEENNVFLKVMKLQQELSKEGTYEDQIPEGIGEFGLDLSNPVPVNGILSSDRYLEKLKTDNGEKISWERIGSFSANNIKNSIDGYTIFDKDRKQIATIYISPYHKTNSNKVPRGFKFA